MSGYNDYLLWLAGAQTPPKMLISEAVCPAPVTIVPGHRGPLTSASTIMRRGWSNRPGRSRAPPAANLQDRRIGSMYTSYTRGVQRAYMPRLRTNIEIEDAYVQTIMDRYGVRTKTQTSSS